MRKIGYLFLILSYILVGFIIIFYNFINPNYNDKLGIIITVVVIIIWLIVPIYLRKTKSEYNNLDKVEIVLKYISLLPILIILIPFFIVYLIISLLDGISNNHKKTFKILLKKGFILKKEKTGNFITYLLTKDNFVFMFTSNYDYVISVDNGKTFINMIDSYFFTYEERCEIKDKIITLKGADYRDICMYDPTSFIVNIINNHF